MSSTSTKSYEFLVKCHGMAKVVAVAHLENLVESIKEKFKIENCCEICIQRFNKEWDEYVDIEADDFSSLQSKEKLNCVVNSKQSKDLNNEFAHTSGSSLNTSCVSDDSDTSSCSSSNYKQCSSLIQWPKHFALSSSKYSRQLLDSVKNEKVLNWACKHELLGHIVDEITKFTYYPSSQQVNEVARCLTDTYTYLTEYIGSGYDGWAQIIRDKMKNFRRNSNAPVVKLQKRKLEGIDKSSKKRTFIPKGANSTPTLPKGENEETCKAHVQTLKKVVMAPQKDMNKIEELMQITFSVRRTFINSCPAVSTILDQYPSLRIQTVFHTEMCRVVGKDSREIFKQNIAKLSIAIVGHAKSKKKQSDNIRNIIMEMEEAIEDLDEVTPEKVNKHNIIASLRLLPMLFLEDGTAVMKVYDEGTLKDEVQKFAVTGPRTPHIISVGAFSTSVHYVVVEGEIVSDSCSSLEDAVYVMFASYYIFNIVFPSSLMNTFSFMQHLLFENTDGKRPSKKVITLSQSLRRS